jgi:hypothetical protein
MHIHSCQPNKFASATVCILFDAVFNFILLQHIVLHCTV